MHDIRKGTDPGANLTTATLIGVDRSTLIKQPITRFIHKEDQDIFCFHRKQMVETGRPQACQLRMMKNDGAALWTSLVFNTSLDTDCASVYRILISDITEHKQMENALHESMEKYRLITDNATDVIWVLDVESQTFTYMSPSVERLLGFLEKEMINRSVAQTATPASLEYIRQATPIRIEKMLQGDTSIYTDEIEVIHKDGHVVPTEINMHFITNRFTGRLEGTGVMRDITKRKQIEKEREFLIVQLQNALAEVKKLKGILPICSYCKKIRDDKGYWNQIEAYIRDRSEAEFSHSICRECAKKYYPDMDIYGD